MPKPPDSAYGNAMTSVVYGLALAPMLDTDNDPKSAAYASDVLKRMAPRDAAEEMLVAQLLFAHARVTRLTLIANRQTSVEALQAVNECADRASNTYRRLMLALAEYRSPPRTGDTFAVVKQTNIAGQQVIQNHENQTRNTTNEQGCTFGSIPAPRAGAALPVDTGGAEVPSFLRPPRPTVEALHRATDTGGQGPSVPKRDEAR